MNPHDFNSPHLITPSGDFKARPPTKGEFVAKPVQKGPPKLFSAEDILVQVKVELDEVQEGDFIRSSEYGVTPRLVEKVDFVNGSTVLWVNVLHSTHANRFGMASLDARVWGNGYPWVKYPNLRILWEAAHKTK